MSRGGGAFSAGRFVGQPLRRNEDRRLLTGRALFIDDVAPSGLLHAAFVRSPHAHARLRGVDVSMAREAAGVAGVFTAEDLGDYWKPGPLLLPPVPVAGAVFHARTQVPLVKDKVRHLGEPIAVIVAESRYLAEDAADLVLVDYEPLPAVVALEAALLPAAPLVHDDLESNLAAHVVQRRGGDFAAVAKTAHRVIERRFVYDRGVAAAIENRGVVAEWDARADRLTVWDTTQAPIPVRNGLAAMLGLSEHQVRLVAPFIGGGFGPKIMMFYPEEVLVPWLAMRLGRPVKWIEDRAENFVATTQERGQIHDAALAVDRDGRILGVRDRFLHDNGAYDPYGLTVPVNSQCTLLGPYRVPCYDSEFRVAFTNKPIVTPVRGAGRQHGVFVMERLLDLAARELGIDRAEIRRRNFLRPEDFPFDNEIIYQDFKPLVYDSGDYEPILDQAIERIGWKDFAKEKQRAAKEGRRLGIGLVAYVEGTGIGPFEGSRIQVQTSGRVTVVTGVGTQGQGHFTSFAQIVAEQLGVDISEIEVVTGDTDRFHWGAGTFASRGAVVAGNAIHATAKAVRAKTLKLAAHELEADEADLELIAGFARVKGAPQKRIALGELARLSNPTRGAVEPGTEPGLEATAYFGPASGATAAGVHAMVVEVDPETYDVRIRRYVVVHDCGTVLNPKIVEGQVHGGVAQGIGNAFYEQLVFDDAGQILNATFMDYLLPTALEVPPIEVGHCETPSPLNELGTKGAGEAGCIPTGALFAQAVEDALGIPGLEIREIPLSPCRLFELAEAAKAAGSDSRGKAR